MKVSAEPFQAPAHLGLTYVLISLLGAAAALLNGWFPLPSFLLVVWLFLLAVYDALGIPLLLFAPRANSQNIVSTRACEKLPRWRVVLVGPLDTPLDTGRMRIATIGRIVALGLLVLLSSLMLFQSWELWWYLQAFPALCLLLTLFFIPLEDETANLDGAGALAVLAAAAERLTKLRSVELWIVALGATTTGNRGLQDFLARYPFSDTETLFLVLERIGSGQLTYAPREGLLGYRSADRLLINLADAVSTHKPLINIRPYPSHAVASIAMLLHLHSYRTLSLVTHMASAGAVKDDTSAACVFKQATQFVTEVVQSLDKSE
jgi:hypothetical protein